MHVLRSTVTTTETRPPHTTLDSGGANHHASPPNGVRSARGRVINITAAMLLGMSVLAANVLAVESADAAPPEGFRSLLNGHDLSGWHGDNPHQGDGAEPESDFTRHWRVEKGELVNDGQGPYATTDEEFGDIELRLEYKTVAKADSGIYLRGTPQVQIWDYTKAGGKWDLGADKGSGGLFNNRPDAAGRHPRVLADKPFGQWNHFRIIQVGSRTTVYLNDQLVVDNAILENYPDKEKPLPPRGPIHLQTHGGEIRWRNIFVRAIGSDEANQHLRGSDAAAGFTPIFNGRNLDGWSGATEDYEVRAGAIVCKEERGGVLHTEETYGDFSVRVEFKLPPGGNNGLAIRYPGSGNPAYDGMTELQVIDNTAEMYAELDPRQYHGSAYGQVAAHRGYLRPVGEWNYQETTVRGSTIRVELNGTVILDADIGPITEFMADTPHPGKSLKQGHFGFAGHNDPVMFRNVAIKRL